MVHFPASLSLADTAAAVLCAAPLSATAAAQELVLLPAGAGIDVALPGGGGCDVVTLNPVAQAAAAAEDGGMGVQLAPIGLIGMLNPGGAVLG